MKCLITPEFFRQALEQDKQLRMALRKTTALHGQLEFADLLKHKGIHLEKLVGLSDPNTGRPLYSVRITASARAIALVDGEALVLLSLHASHDEAYRRR